MKKTKTRSSTLFRSEDDWWHNACVDWSHSRWDAYARGYKEAADILAAHLGQSRGTIDIVVYPLVFLYRQYLELRLKECLNEARKLLNRDAPAKPPDHRLGPLWQELRGMVEDVWPDGDKQPLRQLSRCIQEFSNVDPAAIAFRYPTSTTGEPTLSGLSHINVRHLSETIGEAAKLLDGISCGLAVYLDDLESNAPYD